MSSRGSGTASQVLLMFLFLSVTPFQVCLSHFPGILNKSANAPPTGSIVLPLSGNVYPLGHYTVSIRVGGKSTKLYVFDADTGSELTWIQCDAPCYKCTVPPDQLYKPHDNFLRGDDPLCPGHKDPHERCHYKVDYADGATSSGWLVRDDFTFPMSKGTTVSSLVFCIPRCGTDQRYSGEHQPPATAGLLGLGNGKIGIMSQLFGKGVIRNILAHCLNTKGGGFLFIGDVASPARMSWVPIPHSPKESVHYWSGPAELLHNEKPTGIKGLKVTFDSGATYTYFNSKAYKAVVDQLHGDVKGTPLKPAPEDKALVECWKGPSRFKSIQDFKAYFKPFVLRFANNVRFEFPPEAYLVTSETGNACLGILNAQKEGIGETNLIGDISFQGKMVIYDNEKQRIGWASASCDSPPKS